MSDRVSSKEITAELWADFVDDAEEQPKPIPTLTADQASKHCCLRCGSTALAFPAFPSGPGRPWGYKCKAKNCGQIQSTAKGSGSGTFSCFYCQGSFEEDMPYVRMAHPREERLAYLHADGAACVGRLLGAGSTDVCAAACGAASPDTDVFDMIGVGNTNHFFCGPCKYERRAHLLGACQEQMEKDRIQRKADDTPRKPKKRARTDDGN